MRTSFAAAGAAVMACTALVAPALAADRPLLVKAKPLPAPASWTQFYVGGGIGLNLETGNTTLSSLTTRGVLTIDGLEGANLGLTATAGFDYQLSPLFVVGAFADYDWGSRSTTISISEFGDTLSATTARLDGGWTVGGRAGILATPNILVYGLGGFTQMRLDNWNLTETFAAESLQEPAHTVNGYTVGGGIEYRLTNNISLRGEYRYAKLGTATTVDTTSATSWTTDSAVHIARVLGTYRFGGPGMIAPAAPTRMSAATWTGIYGGLGLGGDAITTQGSGEAIFGTATLSEDGLGGGDVAGTATLGFDYQMQNWVAGVFGLFDFGGNGNARFAFGFSGFPGGGGGSVSGEASSIDNSWTAGGRIGYLVAPDALVYGLAGYTTTNFHSVTYDLGEIAGTTSASDFHGVTVGGGFEKLITDSLSARFEYRNTRYVEQIGFSAPGFTNTESQPTVNSVRVLVAYRLSTMK